MWASPALGRYGHHEPPALQPAAGCAAVLLQLASTQAPVSQCHRKKVVASIDVYARATCQPREVVVPLSTELMGNVVK